MNADRELEKLIDKYGMQTDCLLSERLAAILRDILEKAVRRYGNRVIVRGMKKSEGNSRIISLIAEKATIVAVVDCRPFADEFEMPNGLKVPFLCADAVEEMECDFYFINSFYRYGEILLELRKKYGEGGVGIVTPYQEIRSNYSLCPTKPFEEYGQERDFSHNRLGEALTALRANPTRESLKKLLATALSLRDFVSFFKYLQEGRELLNMPQEFADLEGEIQRLLDKIRSEFRKRERSVGKPKNILWHWIDQVGYDELGLMPELKERLEKKSLFFEHSYTVSPYTKPTVRMIFWNDFRLAGTKKPKENTGGYNRKRLEDSKLYQSIVEAGYEFKCCGYAKKILDVDLEGTELCETSIASCYHYWRAVNTFLNSEKPVFCMVHVLEETHEPFVSPEADFTKNAYEFENSYDSVQEKIRLSARYADRQVAFYSELIGGGVAGIYMSDHGKWEDVDRKRFEDRTMHTFLGITDAGITGRVSRLFTYQYFYLLIRWLLAMQRPEIMFFCDIPLYSEKMKYFAKRRAPESENIFNGYVGIRTDREKYVLLDDGREYYFLEPDETEDMSKNPLCYEKVENLRRQCERQKKEIIENL